MKPLELGGINISRVEEMIWKISPRFLFPGLQNEFFEPYRDWLMPHFLTEDFKLNLSIHTFVIRTAHHTILVDTCIGNDRKRDVPLWDHMNGNYLEKLAAAGARPEEVDFVFCTHMHVDHVGWNTRLENGRWVPTFPNAKYLFNQKEWEFWKDTEEENQLEVMGDSLNPIMEAGLAEMVDDGYAIGDEIKLEPTPGHTPGHCAVHLSGKDHDAVITGDMIHHPFQVARPDITARVDWNQEMAISTRKAFLDTYADTDTRILGTHFAPPTALRVVGAKDGFAIKL